MKIIDLRSDTVTRPDPAMRRAMAVAEVGDDVYGEDPTVNRLQEVAAQRLGKEAALFVPSGTMANQIALRAQTQPGDVVLASRGAHILLYESGGAAALSGVQIHSLGRDGLFDAGEVRGSLAPRNAHFAPTTLVALENTHNSSGGRIVPLDRIREIATVARDAGLGLHLDGARLFNVVAATGIPAATWADPFDTVAFCLSKGLGAPLGSLVCGSSSVIERIHRFRKMLGGGMRQAGVVAAAGLFALENNLDRLVEDHRNARRLADGLTALGLPVDPMPETNMVVFGVEDTHGFLRVTRARNLWINPLSEGRFRAVTHLDVSAEDVEDALSRLNEAVAELRK